MPKFIILKSSRYNPDAPIWSGYAGESCYRAKIKGNQIYNTHDEAQIDANKMSELNGVGFRVCAVQADFYIPIRIAYDYQLFKDHTAYYVRWLPNYPDGGYYRYQIGGITKYSNGLKYMIHLKNPRQAGIDQITVEINQKIEIELNPDTLFSIASGLVGSGSDERGHGYVQSMKALAGDTSKGLPVRKYVEDLQQQWIAQRENPMHRTPYGMGDVFSLTPLGKAVLETIENLPNND